MKQLKTILLSLLAATFLLMPTVPALAATASNIGGNLCNGADFNLDPNATCTDPNGDQAQTSVNNIIKLVINIFSLLVGVVSVIMIIIGGLKYITSGGEGSNITGAKNTIMYAIIGLVVVALAQIIVKFVLAKAASSGQ